jgi:hypothetical protein
MEPAATTPAAENVAEGRRLVAAAGAAGIPAAIFGGVAVAFHAHRPLPASLRREYADVDLVVQGGREGDLGRLLTASGYEPDRKFNALYGYKRQLFWHTESGRQLDVFVGKFAMCHELDLRNRLRDASGTLTPADLLLTKLQIVELNDKDAVDALGLLFEHATGLEKDGDVLGLDRIAAVTGGDWGWHTTVSDNLPKVEAAAARLPDDAQREVQNRLDEVRQALDRAPKSLRWRARARVGRRMPWYELPEEHVR